MITATTPATLLDSLGRLDAWYFLAPGAVASRRLDAAKAAGLEVVRIGGAGGLGRAWMPGRLKQVNAVEGEASVPYIKPHDAFQYLPTADSMLASGRTPRLDDYRIERGWILQTRSGRNLGPNLLVDSYLERFALSDDLIRVKIDDPRMRHYAVAFLRSRTGQGLLRRDKSGSVIDHLAPAQIEAQEIPLVGDAVIDAAAAAIERSFTLTEAARIELAAAVESYESTLPSPTRDHKARLGWTVQARAISDRIDAAPYDPWVEQVRAELGAAGGQRVDTVAAVLKPAGRYKTVYVGADFGRPFMSGTQILQLTAAKPQYMAERAFKDVVDYELQSGWSVYMADGRAEKNLGVPAMITPDREGWLASGHVGRLVPLAGTDPGWLWLAARTWQAQIQIKALASGSVVDSTFPADMDSVILPPPAGADGPAVTAAWKKFAEARAAEAEAIELLDQTLAEISGVDDTDDVAEAPLDLPDLEEDEASPA